MIWDDGTLVIAYELLIHFIHNHPHWEKLERLPLLQLWQARQNRHHSQQIARPAAKIAGGKVKSDAAVTCTCVIMGAVHGNLHSQ